MIAAALTRPADLGLPFASWTLDRLAAYLSEAKGIALRRSRIGGVLRREGLGWRPEATWSGARVDPDFARSKRGRSSSSTPPRPRAAASSSASTRWARRPARAIPVVSR